MGLLDEAELFGVLDSDISLIGWSSKIDEHSRVTQNGGVPGPVVLSAATSAH